MQAYALAVRQLLPTFVNNGSKITVTLHFLEPNVEFQLTEDFLAVELCAQSVDNAILQILSSSEPEEFPVRPAPHCRMCNYLEFCPAGREWIRERRLSS
jgi:hypothetical protein